MKVIGQILTESEMLNTKGGLCALCECDDHSGLWYADYDSFEDADDDIAIFCDGEGSCDHGSSMCGAQQ